MKKQLNKLLPRGVISQVRNYAKLMRIDKPIGIWLLLWPVVWALWLAGDGHPNVADHERIAAGIKNAT